jgi:DNA-binding PadR family transcriptional regulator
MPDRSLPSLTHLQFLVLGALRGAQQPGRVLRDTLASYGVRRTAPAFYQLMARLESTGLVEGWYEQVTVGDQAVTERWYRVTGEGSRQWTRAQNFYSDVARLGGRARLSNA